MDDYFVLAKGFKIAMQVQEIDLEPQNAQYSWKDVLAFEKEQEYFKQTVKAINQERQKGIEIYPPNESVFNAFKFSPLEDLKVVILGQDPYHGPGQAHGLCFSVQPGTAFPPSLQNIFKELKADLGIEIPNHGCLEKWARQGVLLLNTVLTVRRGQAHSHKDLGWERFTDAVIQKVNIHKSNVIFLLWGSHAQKKCAQIDPNRHIILKAPHPSPLSAHRGFLGCKHFSKTNHLLQKLGKEPVDWSL